MSQIAPKLNLLPCFLGFNPHQLTFFLGYNSKQAVTKGLFGNLLGGFPNLLTFLTPSRKYDLGSFWNQGKLPRYEVLIWWYFREWGKELFVPQLLSPDLKPNYTTNNMYEIAKAGPI